MSHHLASGVRPDSWQATKAIASRFEDVSYTLGLHPWFIPNDDSELEGQLHLLRAMLPEASAVGEVGLDRLRGPDLSRQLEVARTQLKWAQELDKPLICHVVRAHSEMLELLGDFPNLRGIIHGFNKSLVLGLRYQDRGFFLGIGPRAHRCHDLIKGLDLDLLALESDGPKWPIGEVPLVTVFEQVCKLRGITHEELQAALRRRLPDLLKLRLSGT